MLPYLLTIIQAIAAGLASLLSKEQSPVPGSADGRKPRTKWLRRILLGLVVLVIPSAQIMSIRWDSVERERDKKILAESNDSLSSQLAQASSELTVQTRLHLSHSNRLAQLYGMLSPITNQLGLPVEEALRKVQQQLTEVRQFDLYREPSDEVVTRTIDQLLNARTVIALGRIKVTIYAETGSRARNSVALALGTLLREGGFEVRGFVPNTSSFAGGTPPPILVKASQARLLDSRVLINALRNYMSGEVSFQPDASLQNDQIEIWLIGSPRFSPDGLAELR